MNLRAQGRLGFKFKLFRALRVMDDAAPGWLSTSVFTHDGLRHNRRGRHPAASLGPTDLLTAPTLWSFTPPAVQSVPCIGLPRAVFYSVAV